MTIDIGDAGHDAFLELVLRGYPDVAQHRAGELGEEAFNEVEPRAMPPFRMLRNDPTAGHVKRCKQGRGAIRL